MANIFKPPCDEAVIRTGTYDSPCIQKLKPWILAATILGSSMAFIDSTVVNVALPAIQSELEATVVELQWIVEAYALFIASLLLVGGALGDRYGRRRIFGLGVTVFGLASVWCGLAPNATHLIFGRAVQGIGGALLIPGSLAMISASFPSEERGRAFGVWSGSTAITASLGPIVGGLLIDYITWRWAFFINIPLALVVMMILWFRVPESRDSETKGALDWTGALLATLGFGGVVFGLIESSNLGFSNPLVYGSLAGGGVSIFVFLVVERRVSRPMVPMKLFSSRTFLGSNVLTFFLYAALGGTLFFLPFNLIQIQGYSATAAGAAFLPLILIIFLLSGWAGGLASRHGPRILLTIGPGIATVGFALFALPTTGAPYWTSFFPAMVLLGSGMALSVAPLTTAVMGSVADNHAGVASGINNAMSRLAALLSIALLGIVIMNSFNKQLDQRLEAISLTPELKQSIDEQRMKLAGMEISGNVADKLKIDIQKAVSTSFVGAFRLVMLIAAGMALASSITGWIIIEKKHL